jgi:predicted dehydrogenase
MHSNYSRRKFIQDMSLGSAAAWIYPACINPPPKKLGIALVGLGNYATNQLAPAIQNSLHTRLAAIVTGSPEKARSWAQKYSIAEKNIYNYQTFDQISQNEEIDIVYIVLPNFLHAEYSIRAAQAGKHVICEKPMAMNSAECEAMLQACKKQNVKLSIGYRLYFEPHHLQLRKWGTEKTYGPVRYMESSLGFSMADPASWRLHKDKGGGGAIMDLGVYCIQGARRTVGELPIRIHAQGYTGDKNVFKGIYEGMSFQMEFPSGAISNSTTTYTAYTDRLHITTGWQWYSLQPAYNAVGTKGQYFDGNLRDMKFPPYDYQQTAQLDDFAQCILQNKESSASGVEGAIDLKIIEAIKSSADGRQPIQLAW